MIESSITVVSRESKSKRFLDLTDQRFGLWGVVRLAGFESTDAVWDCLCFGCLSIHQIRAHSLRSGSSTRCFKCGRRRGKRATSRPKQPKKESCSKRENHGCGIADKKNRSRTYVSWTSMIGRCHSKSCRSYSRYGGRGITVCERWRHSFTAFLSDMGERPGREYSIDRIDNNQGYYPGNCRWATRGQQSVNRCNNIIVKINGVTGCASEWADAIGITHVGFVARLKSGLTGEALLAPRNSFRRNKQKQK